MIKKRFEHPSTQEVYELVVKTKMKCKEYQNKTEEEIDEITFQNGDAFVEGSRLENLINKDRR